MEIYQQKLKLVNDFIEQELYQTIPNDKIKEMTIHALTGGKRLRSILGLIIGKKIQQRNGYSLNLSKCIVFIESLHNVSLIIDDIPCMDNDKFRRGSETIHYKYGIRAAQILSSYILAKSFKLLYSNIKEIQDKDVIEPSILEDNIIEIYRNINRNLGIMGAAGGQFIDTCPINPFMDKEEYISKYSSKADLEELIYLKTTTFYEIAFITPFLLSGGNKEHLSDLRKAVRYFGLFFQLSDDFEDVEQDSTRDNECNPNFVVKFGYLKAEELFYKSIDCFKSMMLKLDIYDPVFDEIIDYLIIKVKKHNKNQT